MKQELVKSVLLAAWITVALSTGLYAAIASPGYITNTQGKDGSGWWCWAWNDIYYDDVSYLINTQSSKVGKDYGAWWPIYYTFKEQNSRLDSDRAEQFVRVEFWKWPWGPSWGIRAFAWTDPPDRGGYGTQYKP